MNLATAITVTSLLFLLALAWFISAMQSWRQLRKEIYTPFHGIKRESLEAEIFCAGLSIVFTGILASVLFFLETFV